MKREACLYAFLSGYSPSQYFSKPSLFCLGLQGIDGFLFDTNKREGRIRPKKTILRYLSEQTLSLPLVVVTEPIAASPVLVCNYSSAHPPIQPYPSSCSCCLMWFHVLVRLYTENNQQSPPTLRPTILLSCASLVSLSSLAHQPPVRIEERNEKRTRNRVLYISFGLTKLWSKARHLRLY